jgi:hypothetical protein
MSQSLGWAWKPPKWRGIPRLKRQKAGQSPQAKLRRPEPKLARWQREHLRSIREEARPLASVRVRPTNAHADNTAPASHRTPRETE